MAKNKFSTLLILIPLFLFSCSVPQYVWRQHDIKTRVINTPALEKKILIASRKSKFKCEVIKAIENKFINKNVFIKIIGINDLSSEDPDNYSAIILINTAMAWKIDNKVNEFINKNKKLDSIIVLTTSGGGDVNPDTEGTEVDAVSSASKLEETDKIADKIINRINKLIQN